MLMFVGSSREPQGAPTADDFTFAINVVVILRDGIHAYRRLFAEWEERGSSGDLRVTALDLARRIAAYARLGFDRTRRPGQAS